MSLELKVGFFIILGVLALVLFVVTQAKGGRLSRGYDISALFDYVAGLEIGSPVRISGVRAGEVRGIEILYEEDVPKVLVNMRIRQDLRIARYSRITIQTLGIIGEKYIEIAPSHHREYIEPGEIVTGENPLSLERLAEASQTIVVRLNDILEDVRNITGEESLQMDIKNIISGSADAIESIERTFASVGELSAEISETNRMFKDVVALQGPMVGELIKNTNALVVSGKDRMEATLDEIRELAAVGRKSADMFDEITDTAREFRAVAESVQVLVEQSSSEVKTVSLGLQEFLHRIQTEGFFAKLMEEEDLVEMVKEEILLLQEATRQFKTTAEDISIFSRSVSEDINLFSRELNEMLFNINQGKGTVGQLLTSDELYREISEFVEDIKENPWKLFIRRR